MNRPANTDAITAASPATAPAKFVSHPEAGLGLVLGIVAYFWWGFIPLYIHFVKDVPPIQILAHRVVWSLVFLIIVMALKGTLREAAVVVRNRRTMLMLLGSTAVLSVNWFTFIFAVEANSVVEASLGYFINPLFNVFLGMTLLRERLRPWQLVGIGLATTGVIFISVARGQMPWIALLLAGSFGFYGLLRKLAPVNAMPGLLIETAMLLVPAIYIIFAMGGDHAPYTPRTRVILGLAGVVTAVPLLCFAAAARRLRLSTLGFLQYIGPTCQFLLAIFFFRETFTSKDLVSFSMIWVALLVYSIDSYRAYRVTTRLLAVET